MRIAFDVSPVAAPRATGIGLAIQNLVQSLIAGDRENHFHFCIRRSRRRYRDRLSLPQRDKVHLHIVQSPFDALLYKKMDLYHGFDTRLPLLCSCPQIATIHDLSSLQPTLYGDERFRRRRRNHYHRAVHRARRIITYSEGVADEVAEKLDYPRWQIETVPPACPPPSSPAPPSVLSCRYQITGAYILSVGAVCRRKNTAGLIRAYLALPPSIRDEVDLVLVGPVQYGGEEAVSLIKTHSRQVHHLENVPPSHLSRLYLDSLFFVLPSHYEGFGLPLVEAMEWGKAVVGSTERTVAEVIGDGGQTVDPDDVEGLARTMANLIEDRESREVWEDRSRRRGRDFRWTDSAEKLREIYREVVG